MKLQESSARRTKELLKFNRNHLRMVGHRNTYRALSPKRTPFQNGTGSPICERCLEEDESTPHILYYCEAITYLRFHHLGHYFVAPDGCHDTPVSRILHFI